MIRTALSILGLALALCLIGVPLLTSDVARADSGDALAEQKTHWQDRYRTLLRNAATLRANATKSRDNYAHAQRRNYPRGGARQQFLIDAEEAEKELAEVEVEIEEIFVEARRNSIPPGWLFEVDDEPIAPAAPASAPSADEGDEDDRAGRNPLYYQDEDEEDR